MSKRIRQNTDNGNVFTRTTGTPRGSFPNFDVEVFSPSAVSKKGAEMTIQFEGKNAINFDGRQIKTLYNVLSKHFNEFENENYY